MTDRILSAEEIWQIKENYPPGTRGTVAFTDDQGQVHPTWDNGRSLAALPQVDQFRKQPSQELQEEQRIRMGEQTL